MTKARACIHEHVDVLAVRVARDGAGRSIAAIHWETLFFVLLRWAPQHQIQQPAPINHQQAVKQKKPAMQRTAKVFGQLSER
jgi:hypothetical protein